jgi:hypothetical protein
MADLSAKGRKTTLAALHAALDHRGSMSTFRTPKLWRMI